MSRHKNHWLRGFALVMMSVVPVEAIAQSAEDPVAMARAQALFDEASKEMDARSFASACKKLEEVTHLVPQGIGARETLGECYENQKKIASAWSQYRAAAAIARAKNEEARSAELEKHAALLRARVSTLTIDVPAALRQLLGLEIMLDNVIVAQTQWGSPLPTDGGAVNLVAKATGYEKFAKLIEVAPEGAAVQAAIPNLKRLSESGTSGIQAGPMDASRQSWRWVGVSAAGLSAVSLALGVWGSVEIVNAQADINKLRPAASWSGSACDPDVAVTLPSSARGACNKQIFGPLQVVFYSLSAVSGIGGGYALVRSYSGTTRRTTLWVEPEIRSDQAVLWAGGNW